MADLMERAKKLDSRLQPWQGCHVQLRSKFSFICIRNFYNILSFYNPTGA